MKRPYLNLNAKEIEHSKTRDDVLRFNSDFNLFHERQIPNTGVILLEGQIELFKRSKTLSTLSPCCLLFIEHLIHQIPANLGCRVKAGSSLVLLGKFEVLEILEDPNSDLFIPIKKSLHE